MRFALILFAIFVSTPSHAQDLQPLQGDAEAVARIEKMYALIGGRERWAAARSMTISYRQWYSGARPGHGVEYAWRDMARPRERLEWIRIDPAGVRTTVGRGNDETRGWRRRADGTIVETAADALKADLKFWERDFYTMFTRMAVGDPRLRYRFTAPNRIDALDPAGAALNWWEIDSIGNVIQWGTTDSDGSTFHWYYGPYKKYGDISFPAWGVSPTFLIRFEYADIRISPNAFPEEVLADPMTPPSPKLLLR